MLHSPQWERSLRPEEVPLAALLPVARAGGLPRAEEVVAPLVGAVVVVLAVGGAGLALAGPEQVVGPLPQHVVVVLPRPAQGKTHERRKLRPSRRRSRNRYFVSAHELFRTWLRGNFAARSAASNPSMINAAAGKGGRSRGVHRVSSFPSKMSYYGTARA